MMNQLPNLITTLRLILTIPIVFFLLHYQIEYALYLFLIAALTDALDGFLARFLNCTSRYGALLDPVADKVLVVFSLGALTHLNFFPGWLFNLVILRDVCIAIFAICLAYKINWRKLAPRWLSKINTVIQLILIIVLLINFSIKPFQEIYIDGLINVLFICTVMSFVDYVWQWSKLLSLNSNSVISS